MYCRNCGKKMEDTSKFCDECGTPADGVVTSVYDNNTSGRRTINLPAVDFSKLAAYDKLYCAISVIVAGIMVAMMFTKWVKIPLLTYASSFASSLFDTDISIPSSFSVLDLIKYFFKLISNDYDQDGVLFFMFINILLWIIILIYLVKYIYVIIKGINRSSRAFSKATVLIVVLFTIDFISMIAINASVNDKTMGYLNMKAVSINSIVYILAAIAVASRVMLVRRVDEELARYKQVRAESNAE